MVFCIRGQLCIRVILSLLDSFPYTATCNVVLEVPFHSRSAVQPQQPQQRAFYGRFFVFCFVVHGGCFLYKVDSPITCDSPPATHTHRIFLYLHDKVDIGYYYP